MPGKPFKNPNLDKDSARLKEKVDATVQQARQSLINLCPKAISKLEGILDDPADQEMLHTAIVTAIRYAGVELPKQDQMVGNRLELTITQAERAVEVQKRMEARR